MSHKWAGWPGAYCRRCGISDPREEALACSKCRLDFGPGPKPDVFDYCEEHLAAIEASKRECQ